MTGSAISRSSWSATTPEAASKLVVRVRFPSPAPAGSAGQVGSRRSSAWLIFAATTTFSRDTPSKWSCRRRSASRQRNNSGCVQISSSLAVSASSTITASQELSRGAEVTCGVPPGGGAPPDGLLPKVLRSLDPAQQERSRPQQLVTARRDELRELPRPIHAATSYSYDASAAGFAASTRRRVFRLRQPHSCVDIDGCREAWFVRLEQLPCQCRRAGRSCGWHGEFHLEGDAGTGFEADGRCAGQ